MFPIHDGNAITEITCEPSGDGGRPQWNPADPTSITCSPGCRDDRSGEMIAPGESVELRQRTGYQWVKDDGTRTVVTHKTCIGPDFKKGY